MAKWRLKRVDPSRLILLVVFHAALPIIILNFYFNFSHKQHLEEWSISNARLLAHTIVKQREEDLKFTKQILVVLSELSAMKQRDVAECERLLADIISLNPLFANLAVADASGEAWCSAVPMVEPINVSDRRYFQDALKHRKFAVGEYSVGRIIPVPVVHAVYPIFNESQKPIGIVLAAISLDWLNKIVAASYLPAGSQVVILDDKGVVISVYPDTDGIGKKIEDHTIRETILAGKPPASFTVLRSGIEYTYTASTFADESGNALYTFIGIPTNYIAQEANDQMIKNVAVTVGAVGLMLAVAYLDWKFFLKRVV